MSKIIIGTPYAMSSLAASGGTHANLSEDRLTKNWDAGAKSSVYVEIDLEEAKAVNTLALLATNLTTASTYRVRGATSQANLTASPGYDSTAGLTGIFAPTGGDDTVLRRPLLHFPAALETYRYWRIDLDDAANPSNIVAGRFMLCRAYQPTYDIAANYEIEYVDSSVGVNIRSGDRLFDSREKVRRVRVSFSFNTKAEAEQEVFPLMRLAGRSAPVLIVLDPNETDFRDDGVVYGRLTADPRIRMISPAYFAFDIEIEEFPNGQVLGKV